MSEVLMQGDAGLPEAEDQARIAEAVRERDGHVKALRDGWVKESKQARVDLDGVLQNLKNAGRASRERNLAITKIQEAIMWLGMDLKALFEPLTEADKFAAARIAYQRYGAVTDFKNSQGLPMPKFDDLSDTIKRAWVEAYPNSPYPNSYKPENAIVDKTADGLKL